MSSTIPPPTTTLNHRTPCPPPLFENALPPPSNPYPPRRNSSNRHSPAAEQPQRWMAGGGSEEVSPGGRGRGGHEDRRSTQAESSGDEITPLASRERGSASGRNYSSTGAKAGDVAGNERVVDTGTGEAGNRRGRRRDGDGNGNGDGEDEKEGWWTRVVEKFGSVELDNKGSVARDHLALERTFLAWLRTSLSFAGIGIAITQLFRLNTTIQQRDGYAPSNPPNTFHLRQLGKPLGATFLGIAIMVLAVGGRRYFESQYWIIRGKFPASRGSIFLVTAVTVALIITSLVVVVTVDPSAFEKRR